MSHAIERLRTEAIIKAGITDQQYGESLERIWGVAGLDVSRITSFSDAQNALSRAGTDLYRVSVGLIERARSPQDRWRIDAGEDRGTLYFGLESGFAVSGEGSKRQGETTSNFRLASRVGPEGSYVTFRESHYGIPNAGTFYDGKVPTSDTLEGAEVTGSRHPYNDGIGGWVKFRLGERLEDPLVYQGFARILQAVARRTTAAVVELTNGTGHI